MSAFAASQWQGTGSKNQLVLGLNGQQAVLSAEDFGQTSTIQIPDPGQSKSSFVLTSSAAGSQTIEGNLTVSGTLTSSGGSNIHELLLNGDLVFSNATDRAIRFDATKQGTDGVDLNVLGNDSNGGAGGNVSVTGGQATSGAKAGGSVVISGGKATGTGGELKLIGGEGVTLGGDVTIISGKATGGVGGNVTIDVGNAGVPGVIKIGTSTDTPPSFIHIGQKIDFLGPIVLSTIGGIAFNSGGNVTMEAVTKSAASPTATVTLNARVGHAVFTGFTTAAGAKEKFTVKNTEHSNITPVFATVCNKGAADAQMTLTRVNTETAGTLIFDTINNGAGVLNGDVQINFWLISLSS